MATKAKPAAASSKTPPELEEKKSAASDTELKQRGALCLLYVWAACHSLVSGLDDALFTLLKQLSRTALHSTTSLQAVIDVLDKEEYRTIEEVKLITMDHLKEWFPGARKTQDVLLKLFCAPLSGCALLTPFRSRLQPLSGATQWCVSPVVVLRALCT